MADAPHPIVDDIDREHLEAVKQHVLADPAVLEEKDGLQTTPLMYAIHQRDPTIAHWIIEHRGQHDVNTQDSAGRTALHCACCFGPLSIVQALVTSGADPSVTDARRVTPLLMAIDNGHSDIVAFLLQLPAVRAIINAVDQYGYSALSYASRSGHQLIVQLLLDAGADPTIPAGNESPLNLAIRYHRTAIAALLRHAIAEPDRARTLHKARALLDAGLAVRKAGSQQPRRMLTRGQQKRAAIAAAPVCLKGRVQRDEALPVPELAPQQGDERVRATVAFVLGGLEEGGVAYVGLPQEVYVELLGYMLHAWADKGPGGEQEA